MKNERCFRASVFGKLLWNYRSIGMNINLKSNPIVCLFQFDFVCHVSHSVKQYKKYCKKILSRGIQGTYEMA